MLHFLFLATLLFSASALCAQISSLPQLLDRQQEIYDDPKAFRLELEHALENVDRHTDPEFWTALHAFSAQAAWYEEQNAIARSHSEAALPFAEEKGFKRYASRLTYVQGGVLEYEAKAEEAESYFLKAIEIARQTGDVALIAHTASAAGSFFHRSGKHDRAAEAFKEVLQLLSQLPQDAHYYDMLSCIGTLYFQTIGPRRSEGIRMLQDSLDYARTHKLRYENYWISQTSLLIYKESNELEEVESLLSDNLKLAQSLGYENYLANAHMERGQFRLEMRRYSEALEDLEYARSYYSKLDVSFYDIPILSSLGTVYVALKQYDKVAKLVDALSDTLKATSSTVHKQMVNAMLQKYYEATDQKDKELVALRELLDLVTKNAEHKQVEELGRLARDMEVQRQQYLNERLTDENKVQNEEIQRQERTQKLMFSMLILAALALATSGLALRRGREIKLQRANLKLILDNIEEGILRFGSELLIQAESSRYTGELLSQAESLEGQSIWDLLFAQVPCSGADKQLWRESLRAIFGESSLAWELNEGNLPREVRLGERILALDWQILPAADGSTQTMLLLIRNITRQVAAQKEAAVAQERISKMADRIDAIARGRPQRIAQFLVEAEKTILPLQKNISMEENYSDIKRMLHTLKGSARTLGLKDITDIVHGFEDLFMTQDLDHLGFATHMQQLLESLNAYRDLLPHLNMVQGHTLENLWDMASKLLPEARERLAKRFALPANFQVLDRFENWDRIDKRSVHDMLLHAITNSIDHGFLLPHARGERLSDAPALTLEANQASTRLILTLRDNGFGINWKHLEGLARQRGFQPEPGREITDLLFQEGTSTAAQISTTSGRGMGLSAVKEMVQRLGGDVSLHDNDQGPGACLRMILPIPGYDVSAA